MCSLLAVTAEDANYASVGEISDIVLGGWDTFSLISKAMDVASLAKTLDKDSEIFKILGIGLRAEEEVAGASEATEEAMSVEAVATRGKLGSSVTKAQDAVLKCTSSSFQAFAMDASKLGSILPSLARRSFHRNTHSATSSTILPKRRHISQRPLKRAPSAGSCLFKTQVRSSMERYTTNWISDRFRPQDRRCKSYQFMQLVQLSNGSTQRSYGAHE
jgi:hypothetical protein